MFFLLQLGECQLLVKKKTGEGGNEHVEDREEEWTRHAVTLLLCRGDKLHLCLHSSVNIRM